MISVFYFRASHSVIHLHIYVRLVHMAVEVKGGPEKQPSSYDNKLFSKSSTSLSYIFPCDPDRQMCSSSEWCSMYIFIWGHSVSTVIVIVCCRSSMNSPNALLSTFLGFFSNFLIPNSPRCDTLPLIIPMQDVYLWSIVYKYTMLYPSSICNQFLIDFFVLGSLWSCIFRIPSFCSIRIYV